jgi:flagellar hook protein FlgE
MGISGTFTAARGSVPGIMAGGDTDRFMNESITGGGVTVYSDTGEPINLQLRWAKIDNTAGAEKWSLYYASDTRTGAATPWTQMGEYSFNQGVLTGITAAAGMTSNGTDQIAFNNLTVNGSAVGPVTVDHGLKGMTQFADNAGSATTTTMSQNGFGAGEFISVGLNDQSQIVASYSNGQTKQVAQILIANFSDANALKRGDGGTFTETSASGAAILSADGGVVGSSLEASNTDISEEFTKLIVTQQAYSANTRIVTAASDMLKETLSMIR